MILTKTQATKFLVPIDFSYLVVSSIDFVLFTSLLILWGVWLLYLQTYSADQGLSSKRVFNGKGNIAVPSNLLFVGGVSIALPVTILPWHALR